MNAVIIYAQHVEYIIVCTVKKYIMRDRKGSQLTKSHKMIHKMRERERDKATKTKGSQLRSDDDHSQRIIPHSSQWSGDGDGDSEVTEKSLNLFIYCSSIKYYIQTPYTLIFRCFLFLLLLFVYLFFKLCTYRCTHGVKLQFTHMMIDANASTFFFSLNVQSVKVEVDRCNFVVLFFLLAI